MGAILAHELTHHFLESKHIHLPSTDENEKLTDLATSYLGLGKLTLNGYEPISWEIIKNGRKSTFTYNVGYLSSYDMALINNKISLFRNINKNKILQNLTDKATYLINESNSELNYYNQKKENTGERFCPRCNKITKFELNESDCGVYCSSCGWEWFAMQSIIKNTKEPFLKRILKMFEQKKIGYSLITTI